MQRCTVMLYEAALGRRVNLMHVPDKGKHQRHPQSELRRVIAHAQKESSLKVQPRAAGSVQHVPRCCSQTRLTSQIQLKCNYAEDCFGLIVVLLCAIKYVTTLLVLYAH